MHTVNSDRESLEFVGTADLPAEPFRVAVKGSDSNGNNTIDFFLIYFMSRACSSP